MTPPVTDTIDRGVDLRDIYDKIGEISVALARNETTLQHLVEVLQSLIEKLEKMDVRVRTLELGCPREYRWDEIDKEIEAIKTRIQNLSEDHDSRLKKMELGKCPRDDRIKKIEDDIKILKDAHNIETGKYFVINKAIAWLVGILGSVVGACLIYLILQK